MSAEYIIDRFGKKVGLNAGDDNQRFVILDFLNEAMQAVYEYVDIPGSLVEEEFYVAGNQKVATHGNNFHKRFNSNRTYCTRLCKHSGNREGCNYV